MVTLVVHRAQNPRTDHENLCFDTAMAAFVDRCGTEPVRTVIHRVLLDNNPFWTVTKGVELRSGGARIGTTASGWPEELNAHRAIVEVTGHESFPTGVKLQALCMCRNHCSPTCRTHA